MAAASRGSREGEVRIDVIRGRAMMHGRCVHCGKRELKEGRDRGSYNECAFLRRRRRHTQARGGGDLSIKFIGGDLGRGGDDERNPC